MYSKTFFVGQETAFAPGFSPSGQVIWLAGTIVHDACHSYQYAEGNAFFGKEAEVQCLMRQQAALELIDDDTFFSGYVAGLIEGADDPDNAYWNDPDRHW